MFALADQESVARFLTVADLSSLRDSVCEAAARFETDYLAPHEAATALGLAAAMKNAAATIEALAAARAAQGEAWKQAGHRSPAEWLAGATGTTTGAARDVLVTGTRLRTFGETDAAARRGELSPAQTAAIVDAASAAPAAEAVLLDTARTDSLGSLRDACLRTKAAADPDPDATHERIRRCRHARTHNDAEGAWNLTARGTVEQGARIDAALTAEADRLFVEARRSGKREDRDAYLFDALHNLVTRDGTPGDDQPAGSSPRWLGLVRVDHAALVRGRAEGDELCEITGVGPVPVAIARDLLGEAVLHLVITRGHDVATTVHLGRGPNAAQKIALAWAQPRCTRASCNATIGLQADHRVPWTDEQVTELTNLDRLCPHDHYLKTHHGWQLAAGSGRRPLLPPDEGGAAEGAEGGPDPPDSS